MLKFHVDKKVSGKLRNSVLGKILWGFMSFYLLNLSVDAVDTTPIYLSEDIRINDQESIIELLIEKVLGYDHAIPESENGDSDEKNDKKGLSKMEFPLTSTTYENHIFHRISEPENLFAPPEISLKIGFERAYSPPPEV